MSALDGCSHYNMPHSVLHFSSAVSSEITVNRHRFTLQIWSFAIFTFITIATATFSLRLSAGGVQLHSAPVPQMLRSTYYKVQLKA